MRISINVDGHDHTVDFESQPTEADINEAAQALRAKYGRTPARLAGALPTGEIPPARPDLSGLNLPPQGQPAQGPTMRPGAPVQTWQKTHGPPPSLGTIQGTISDSLKRLPIIGGALQSKPNPAGDAATAYARMHQTPQQTPMQGALQQAAAAKKAIKEHPERYPSPNATESIRKDLNASQEAIASWIRGIPVLGDALGAANVVNEFINPISQVKNVVDVAKGTVPNPAAKAGEAFKKGAEPVAQILNTPMRIAGNAQIAVQPGTTLADRVWSGADLAVDTLPLWGGAAVKGLKIIQAAVPELQSVEALAATLKAGNRNAAKIHNAIEEALSSGIHPEEFKKAFGNDPTVSTAIDGVASRMKPTVTNPKATQPGIAGLASGEDSFTSPAKTVPFKPVEPGIANPETGLLDAQGNPAGRGTTPPKLEIPEGAPKVEPVAEPTVEPAVETKPTRTRAPKAPVVEETTSEAVPKAPGEDTGGRIRLSSVKHADTRAMETELGIPSQDPKTSVSIGTALVNAEKEGIISDAHNIAAAVVKKPRPLSYEETVGLGARGQQLTKEREALQGQLAEAILKGDADKADVLRGKISDNRDQIYNISQALDQAGTEAGRAFNARKALLQDDYSAFGLTKRAIVRKGGNLTPEQEAIFNNHAKTIESLNAEVERLKSAAARTKAERAMQPVRANPPRAARNYRFTEERIAASRKNLMALHSNPVLPVAEHLYNIAGYHIERGVYKVADLIQNLKDEGKLIGYNVSDADAADAIERAARSVSNVANKGRGFGEDIQIVGNSGIQSSEVARARQELDALKGELSKAANAPDKGLIKDLGDQVTQLENAAKGGDLQAQQKLVSEINATRRKLNQGSALGENILQSGKAAVEDPQVSQLRERIEMQKIKAERDLAKVQAEAEWEAMTKWQRSGVWAQDLANLPKGLKASFDASAPLRQGIFYAITKPKLWAKSVKSMLGAMMKEDYALRVEGEIRASKYYDLGQRSKLFIADQAAPLSAHEEAFMSSRIGKYIPGYKASERGYVTFLNKLRQDAFDSLVEGFTSKGKPVSKELAEDIARMVNQNTGRGTGKIADALSTANRIGFAPRYTYSRFQMLKPLAGATTAEGKKLALQEYAKFIGAVGTAAGLLKLSGADIELDARSSQYLKVKVGHTYVDFFGGAQMPIKFAASFGGSKNLQTGAIQPRNVADIVGGFVSNKLDPVTSVWAHGLTGKDFLGNSYARSWGDTGKVLNDLMGPISAGQTVENFQNNDPATATALSAGSLFGADTSTINPKSDALGRPYVRGAEDDIVAKELTRIGVTRSMPDKRDGEAPDEYQARAKAEGDFMRAYLDKFIDTPSYKNATPTEKKIFVQRVTTALSKQFNAAYSQRQAAQKRMEMQKQISEERRTGIR